jgi:hypothetical protein
VTSRGRVWRTACTVPSQVCAVVRHGAGCCSSLLATTYPNCKAKQPQVPSMRQRYACQSVSLLICPAAVSLCAALVSGCRRLPCGWLQLHLLTPQPGGQVGWGCNCVQQLAAGGTYWLWRWLAGRGCVLPACGHTVACTSPVAHSTMWCVVPLLCNAELQCCRSCVARFADSTCLPLSSSPGSRAAAAGGGCSESDLELLLRVRKCLTELDVADGQDEEAGQHTHAKFRRCFGALLTRQRRTRCLPACAW